MFKQSKSLKFNIFAAITALLLLYANTAQARVFKLHLYFDTEKNQIVQDGDVENKVELSGDAYAVEEPESSDYSYKRFNFGNNEYSPVYFTPQPGKFTLEVPYFQENSRIAIYHKEDSMLSVDVSQFATCNVNGACEAGLGENATSCVADCFKAEMTKKNPDISTNTNGSSNTNPNRNANGSPSDPLTGGNANTNSATTPVKSPFFGLIVGLGMIVGGIGYGIYRLIKGRQGKE